MIQIYTQPVNAEQLQQTGKQTLGAEEEVNP